MENIQNGISPYTVNLPRYALKQMISVVSNLQSLSESPDYYTSLLTELPANAQVNAKHYSVLMGYDFHITAEQQVKLIEVNTNAGGLWFACQSYDANAQQLPVKIADKLLATFIQEFQLFSQNKSAKPKLIAIVDSNPKEQFLYPEMQQIAQLFTQAGIKAVIIDPSEIEHQKQGLYHQNQRIDLIYNRHCDFYLNTPEMQHIAAAWQQQSVCLTPNPCIYGLLADKQRMVNWTQSEILQDILAPKVALDLQKAIPNTFNLHTFNPEHLWSERKKWVFKPTTSYASRGVYIGNKLTKSKLSSFDSQTTLVQQFIKPSVTLTTDAKKFKTDFRLFVYRDTILAVCARIYQGQVTNLRTPHGGFSKIKLI
ncbi:MAG: hypothetical protein methR_P0491 [Methyloprofundus sp.]|nr:MAG: hypothetical protein methR_P0491 [Methyloprofundus sp.]